MPQAAFSYVLGVLPQGQRVLHLLPTDFCTIYSVVGGGGGIRGAGFGNAILSWWRKDSVPPGPRHRLYGSKRQPSSGQPLVEVRLPRVRARTSTCAGVEGEAAGDEGLLLAPVPVAGGGRSVCVASTRTPSDPIQGGTWVRLDTGIRFGPLIRADEGLSGAGQGQSLFRDVALQGAEGSSRLPGHGPNRFREGRSVALRGGSADGPQAGSSAKIFAAAGEWGCGAAAPDQNNSKLIDVSQPLDPPAGPPPVLPRQMHPSP